ncbi:NAD(+)/NADH kinase [Halobellus rufus]|uniref:NAD(+)/NADH kinase n=1 Tax=Halobellus rufus TaxID=1448860 RepID=UPI0006789BC7|nr:NAD(+)/NADH kinase [Halobellus rufus]
MSVRCLLARDRGSTSPGDVEGEVLDALDAQAGITTEAVGADEVASGVDDADAVFALGAAALEALATSGVDCPVVPVDAGVRRYDVAPEDAPAIAEALLAGELDTDPHPVLAVDVDGDRAGYAVYDVTLMTSEPAKISEYGVETADGWNDTVRSDGVVVATPLGSTGYARAVGGPTLGPETGVLAIPVSPYAMNPETWVLQAPITLSIERDEANVSLHLDDDVVRSVPPNVPVDVTADRTLPVVSVRK